MMAHPRKICIVTGGRMEFGHLFWLMKDIQADPELELQVVVTGMHLSPIYGNTYQDIEAAGFAIDEKVEMLLGNDSPVAIAKSMGLATIGFADAFERLQPDVIVLLGDRYELLACAQAAMVARIPIAHIHGGETTEGAMDEAIRHALTKMSHLHFVAAEAYRQRVIQLGEAPERVWDFGAPGLDHLKRLELLDRAALEKSIGFSWGNPTFLITFHPVTLESESPVEAIQNLLDALTEFPEAHCLFTKHNSDTAGHLIGECIEKFVQQSPSTRKEVASLGQLRYLSAITHADVVIGNSSSGLIEVPALKKPTINIGDRQKGRLQASSVISCPSQKDSIVHSIQKALSGDFQLSLKDTQSLYGEGNTSSQIKEVLKHAELKQILMKSFHNIV